MGVRVDLRWLALIAIGAAAACSRAPGDASSGGSQAGSTPSNRNACQLLARDDMERLHGASVTFFHNIEAETRSTCEVLDAQTNQAVLSLEAVWSGGRDAARSEGTAKGVAAGLLGDGSVNLEPLIGTASARGPANDAYYSDVATSWVLKGDVLLRFKLGALTREQRTANFVPIARKAIDRLP